MITKKKNIQFSDYDISIKKKKDNYYGYIPELSLYSSGTSSNLVLKNLEKQFNEMVKYYQKIDSLHHVKKPYKKKKLVFLKNELLLFSLKLTLIGFIFSIFLIISSTFLANKIQQISFVDIFSAESKKIFNLINEKLDPYDNKNQNLEKFKSFLEKIKPYINSYNEEINNR